jgi:hypothetical protein
LPGAVDTAESAVARAFGISVRVALTAVPAPTVAQRPAAKAIAARKRSSIGGLNCETFP